MLRGLRKASSNWLGKAVMAAVVGFLVISFAIWGIGDIFRGFGRSTVAKIGRTEVTIEQFRTLYNDRLQQYSRQLGRPISADQARATGLDRLVIGQIFSEILLDERARALGLALSDSEVAKLITNDPAFRGPNGQFDRFRFEQTIRNAGYTEARFVAEQRRQMLRRELAGTIASGLNAPKALVEALNRYQNEQRSIEYVLLDRALAGEIASPPPEALAKYFEDRKILFRTPEYRKLVVVSLIPSEQARWIEISDADLKRAYEERRARYVTPERRHILQIDFPNAEAASAAAERIAKGTSFAEIAKELGKSEKDIDLGIVPKSAMIDRPVADAAFALKEGEVSAPAQGRFGTVLVQALKIEPEQVRPLEQVAGELKQELATARAKSEIFDVYNKIEDARAEGKSLEEAAANLKLEARTVEVDRSGRDPAGTPVKLPDAQRLLAGAFTTDIGVERDPLQFQDGYTWYEVTAISPSRERSLDEVKDQVEARWRDQEVATRLDAKATAILEKLKAGETLPQAAAADRLKVETLTGLKRGEASGPLSAAGVDAVFRTAKDTVGKTEGAQPPDEVVFRVTDIVVPSLDMASEDAKRALETLNRGLSEDILAEYIAWLESDIGVTINQSALNQVVSGGAGDGTN
ncbi:MAG: peptidylprolyl isomerase [Alphaproteobacteria bacterium 13_2_20CM_2_64_7]|jgi:peptidyl-prolyl cis-trans isomerase D|nr:MAG: peptidylprolyl isomerase [Alphaproteobacteria bacterium 13_2_20CM_2_64_7]